jgi:hypothetical protein
MQVDHEGDTGLKAPSHLQIKAYSDAETEGQVPSKICADEGWWESFEIE